VQLPAPAPVADHAQVAEVDLQLPARSPSATGIVTAGRDDNAKPHSAAVNRASVR
jgi:hypothetical protein